MGDCQYYMALITKTIVQQLSQQLPMLYHFAPYLDCYFLYDHVKRFEEQSLPILQAMANAGYPSCLH